MALAESPEITPTYRVLASNGLGGFYGLSLEQARSTRDWINQRGTLPHIILGPDDRDLNIPWTEPGPFGSRIIKTEVNPLDVVKVLANVMIPLRLV